MIRGVILDLDGTVYFGTDEVPGAGSFVAGCRDMGIRCLFVTNRANRVPEEIVRQLRGHGIPCEPGDVLTAAQATARYLRRGSAWYIGEEGLRRALQEQGIAITEERPDYVVVGYDRGFNYEKLFNACRLIDGGARFIATNPDRALKTEKGIYPGTGAIVEAVAAGTGRRPVIVGKPERLIMDMALERLGMGPDEVIVVGDSLATDVPAGHAAGMLSVLLLTGVSRREDVAHSAVKPDWVVGTFDELLSRVRDESAKPCSGKAASPDTGCPAADEWVTRLGLQIHPEGGWYRETYRSDAVLRSTALPAGFGGDRAASTAIYYLLARNQSSRFHRIKSDEVWHLYDGGPLLIHCISPGGEYVCLRLGKGEGQPQHVVPAGTWFAAEPGDGVGYALAGCTVAPGFDFADFELGRRSELTRIFPRHRELIERLTV